MTERPPPTNAELRAAKRRVATMLGGRDGVEGFGIGDGCVRVYVRVRTMSSELPDEVDGVPVRCIEVGDVTAR